MPPKTIKKTSKAKSSESKGKSSSIGGLHQNISQIKATLFDPEGECMLFSFGYINQQMTAVPIPGAQPGEPCVPSPKAWTIGEPVAKLVASKPALVPMLVDPYFSAGFKLYTEATPSAYFFDGKPQKEQEFARDIVKGATVFAFLEALHDIFVDAKVHPCEPMMIFDLTVDNDANVHIAFGR